MALQILIDGRDGQEPTLHHAVHTHNKDQIKALNTTIQEFERKHGYPFLRIVVSGGYITVKKPGELDIIPPK